MLKNNLFSFFLLLSCWASAQAINYNFINYSTENGLPTNSIQSVHTDAYGYLWLATFDGLARWDGYTFKKYTHEEQDPRSLDNNIVNTLFEDSHQRLWIGTIDGLSLYDRTRDEFIRCPVKTGGEKVPVNAITEDRQGQLWLGTSDGLCRYDAGLHKAEWFAAGRETDVIFCLTPGADGQLWLGTFNKGVLRFYTNTHRYEVLDHETAALPSNKIRSIMADREHHIWVGTEDQGIMVLNEAGQLQKSYPHFTGGPASPGTINCLYEDKTGTVWIGVRRGPVYAIRTNGGEPVALSSTSLNNDHQQPASITAICEDQFGNTWFASNNDGLFCTNGNKNKFRNYLYDPSSAGGLQSRAVTCLHEDAQGMIWIGTNGSGLLRLDPRTNTITRPSSFPLPSGILYDIKGDGQGNLWIASWGAGVITFNPASGSSRQYQYQAQDPNSIIFNDVKAVLPDDSVVWIGTHGEGLAAFDRKNGRFIHYRNNTSLPFSLHDPAWINHLFKDSKKRLWISTYGGLFVFDGKKLAHFEHGTDTGTISSNSVNMTAEDSAGTIWVASESGLDRYEETDGRFSRYTARLALPQSMKSIVVGRDGRLWIGSTEGIVSFDPRTLAVRRYDMVDGLPDNSFFQKSVLSTRDGILYFGSPKGLSAFYPNDLKDLRLPTYFYFSDLYVYNKKQLPGLEGSPLGKVLPFSDTIALRPGQSAFAIDFDAINLYAPGRAKYAYKLEGFYGEWINTNGERRAVFTNLSPGTYTLRVRYTDINGQWHVVDKTLTIRVLPAWWQTWWFRYALLLFVTAAVVLVFYLRTSSIKKRNRLLKEEVQKRTGELSQVNASLVEQNDEIKAQKESLEVSNEEIRRQSDKILAQQQHITSQNQELERSVEQLRELNDTKNYFFSILAHDLRNPISAFTELADFIQANFQKINRKELEQYIDSMHKSSRSVQELLINLLQWSRTQTNRVTPRPALLVLATLVEKNRELLRSQLVKKNIRLEVHINAHYQVWADQDMIDTAIRNIISNAIKFTEYNGRIEVHAAEKEGTVILRITDTGIGMSTTQLDQLFQIDRMQVVAGTAGERGTGLGLVVTREFIESNKGTLWVESTPGKGSSFYIQLPSADDAPPESIAASDVKKIALRPELEFWDKVPVEKLLKIKGRKILIVDDNAEVRNYLKLVLSDTFEIFEAANGRAALKTALDVVPAVIVTDLLMPEMNGLEFCQAIKEQTATSHIPVVVLTSQWDESMQVSGYEAGADVYLTKPVKKELLIQVVLNLLQNQERQRERTLETIMADHTVKADAEHLNKLDENFLNRLVKIIEAHVADPNLDARLLCREMATSRTVLYTKLKTLTGQTVHEFIKSIRLRKSLKLLLDGELSVSQVAFEVGFNSHSYFDKCFVKQYGMGPREYVNKKRGNAS